MIANDLELHGTLERIAYLCRLLSQIRLTARSEEDYWCFSNSYLAEVEKMNAEVVEYFRCSPAIPSPTEAATPEAHELGRAVHTSLDLPA